MRNYHVVKQLDPEWGERLAQFLSVGDIGGGGDSAATRVIVYKYHCRTLALKSPSDYYLYVHYCRILTA